jgi:hypothetical protein
VGGQGEEINLSKNLINAIIPYMSKEKMTKLLKKYQKTSPGTKKRSRFFSDFEKKMIYRTTKTENPRTTAKTVNKVLRKLKTKKR